MEDIRHLLDRTSRTFALAVPLLPEPTQRQITISYLLFRIADTVEDATRWPQESRIDALEAYCRILQERDAELARASSKSWAREIPVEHDGYRELLEETPFVLEQFWSLPEAAQTQATSHVVRTARGMAGFVSRTGEDGVLRLGTLQELRDYCYVVAGIVGELCTELFLLNRSGLDSIAPYLRNRAPRFGEGLQLVNILKDSSTDVEEGRYYLPPSIERGEVFALARRDLELATEYIAALQEGGAERGLVAFNALPVRFAWATLSRVEEGGPGSKISHAEVRDIMLALQEALDESRPAVSVPPSRRVRA